MYAKLFTSIYQGTLRGNSHGLLVFTNLLAHADSAGHVDIHPKAIAEEVGLTQEQVRNALDDLEAPDLESRSPEEDGRRIVRLDAHRAWGWRVVNYVKYRSIRNEEDRREQNRLAQERFRQKSKQSKPRKPESAQAEAEAEEEKKENTAGAIAPSSFPDFWERWPKHQRKVARQQCARAWASKRCDTFAQVVIDALEAAKRSEAWSEQGGKFIPAPLVWLNQSRWEAPTLQKSPDVIAESQAAETSAYLARQAEVTPNAELARAARAAVRLVK